MKLHNLIGLIAQYNPNETLKLSSRGGGAIDKAGYLIMNLSTEQDIFSDEEWHDVEIEIIK